MAELTIKLSDKALSLIAQLQKEIFNRRRKKVQPSGVVETLVESAAKSQSDKRFATSWKNLVADIEKAAKLADEHGSKPSSLTDEEWAMVLSFRTRPPRKTPTKSAAVKPAAKRPAAKKSVPRKTRSTSVAKRMAKAARKLGNEAVPAVSQTPEGGDSLSS